MKSEFFFGKDLSENFNKAKSVQLGLYLLLYSCDLVLACLHYLRTNFNPILAPKNCKHLTVIDEVQPEKLEIEAAAYLETLK